MIRIPIVLMFDNDSSISINICFKTYINICLVGCVSAGKSTILNAFFGQDFAQCKIKRTTMMPNKFIETDDPKQITSSKEINEIIKKMNDQIYTQTQNGIKLKLSEHNAHGELTFYVDNMEMNIGQKIKICMYDIPGLNDGRTKETYYEYVLDSNAEQIIEWEGHKRQDFSIRNRQTTRPRRQ